MYDRYLRSPVAGYSGALDVECQERPRYGCQSRQPRQVHAESRILNEIYFPRIDRACTRDLGFIVAEEPDGHWSQNMWPDGAAYWQGIQMDDEDVMAGREDMPSGVRLVVADVDGTLVTPDKILTPRARAVVRTIIEAGIAFTITSGRPPLGMKGLIDDLQLRDPITAFNGGLVVRPDLSVIREHLLPGEAARGVIDLLTKERLDVWVYGAKDWYVGSLKGPHVAREEWTVKFPPIVVPTYEGLLDGIVKIVGVSDDHDAMARCVTEVQRQFGQHVSAALSQPYYLDVTHPRANKGEVVNALSALLGIPAAQVVTIGDMPNDVLMFQRSGVSIAMGNASLDVQHSATFVTASNTEDGFARAMQRFVLRGRTPLS